MHFGTIILFVCISLLSVKSNEAKDVNRNCECGKSTIPQTAVNVPTVAKEYPWQVFIRVRHDKANEEVPLRGRVWKKGFHDCGGTIINDLFILTSSNCIFKFLPKRDASKKKDFTNVMKKRLFDPSKIFVFPKKTVKNVDGSIPSDNSEYWTVEKIFHNAQLPFQERSNNKDFDIALLKLHKRLEFQSQDEILPICLPPDDNFPLKNWNSVFKIIVGWISKPNGASDASNKLEKLKPGVVYDNCEEMYEEEVNDGNYVCSTQQAKYMDVGSPMIGYANNFAIQLGILSWIVPDHKLNGKCGQMQTKLEKSHPFGLFTKLNSKAMQQFIEKHTTEEGARWCATPSSFSLQMQPTTEKLYDEPWKNAANKVPPKEVYCFCGIREKRSAASRIVGGESATPYEFPWLTLVTRKRENSSPARCGASIINDRMILTAAHCVTLLFGEDRNEVNIPRFPDPYTVYLHIHKYSETNSTNGEYKRFSVERIIVHPDYLIASYLDNEEDPTDNNDIALLVLTKKINIKSSRFTPVCLPKDGEVIDLTGKQATIAGINSFTANIEGTSAGWGVVNRVQRPISLVPTDAVKKIVVPIHSDADCEKFSPKIRTDLFICADPNTPEGSNRGDSGGPLVMEMPSEEFIQIGVVSHGTPFSDKDPEKNRNTVTIYTRVTAYVDWIYYHAAAVDANWCKHKS